MAATFHAVPHGWELPTVDDQRPVILVTTVELGPGISGTITLYDGDDPREAAERFCLDQGLPPNVVEPLTLHILENLDSIEQQTGFNDDDGGLGQQEEDMTISTVELSQAEDVHAVMPPPPPLPPSSISKQPAEQIRQQQRPISALKKHRQEQEQLPPSTTTASSPLALLPPLARPTSATSSLATEYYGRPLNSASTQRTAEAVAAPAADRLYADHFRKQAMLEEQRRIRDLELQLATQHVYVTPVSQALASHRTAGGYSSYGERLYVEGRLEAMRKEAEAAQIREEEDAAELESLTFTPQISKFAETIKARNARSSTYAAPTWDRLYSKGSAMKKERRAEAIRRELDEAELKECSFQPRVDGRSARLVQQRRGASGGMLPLHERLYNEGIYSKVKLKQLSEQWMPDEATFKPKINKQHQARNTTSRVHMCDLMDAVANDKGGSMVRDVAERLLMRGLKTQEKIAALRRAYTANVDERGRPLFVPQTLEKLPHGVQISRQRNARDIGEHLYSAALESAAKVQALNQAAKKQAQERSEVVYVNPTSLKMMEKLKRERFRAVYAYLGNSRSTASTPPESLDLIEVLGDDVFMDTIDPEVRADIEHAGRLLMKRRKKKEQQQKQQQEDVGDDQEQQQGEGTSMHDAVAESEFIELMMDVINRTRGISRQYLQPMPPARKKWEDPTFQPLPDPTSLALASRMRPEGIPAHEILYQTAFEYNERKGVARKESEAMAMKECSFEPALVSEQLKHVTRGRALQMATERKGQRGGGTQETQGVRKEEEEQAASKKVVEQKRKQSGTVPILATATTITTQSVKSNHDLEDGIDAIERQIQVAMARLSMTGETFVANLEPPRRVQQPLSINNGAETQIPLDFDLKIHQEEEEEAAAAAPPTGLDPAPHPLLPNAHELAARLRASLDYHALFDASTPPPLHRPPSSCGEAPPPPPPPMAEMGETPCTTTSAAVQISEYNPLVMGEDDSLSVADLADKYINSCRKSTLDESL